MVLRKWLITFWVWLHRRLPKLMVSYHRALLHYAIMLTGFPKRVERMPVTIDGLKGVWLYEQGCLGGRTILYFHGGGYMVGSIETHDGFVGRLCREAGARGLLIDYRLAPEHPFPAGLEDALKAYRFLLAQGIDPKSIAFGGDSAGGGLTLATLLALRDAGEPLPGAALLFSPWANLAYWKDPASRRRNGYFRCLLEFFTDAYGSGKDLKSPLLSPVFGDYSGFPPMLIQAGAREMISSESKQVYEAAKAKGVEVHLDIYPGTFHVLPAVAPLWGLSTRLTSRAGGWLRKALVEQAETPLQKG